MRFAWLIVLVSCGGKVLVDADAGDAAATKDASDATTTSDGGGGGFFPCGETGHFINCDSTAQYCQLIKTSKAHDYSCQTLPAPCTQTASAPYDCGCYQSGDEIFLTICK
jgi:hypothetical protein